MQWGEWTVDEVNVWGETWKMYELSIGRIEIQKWGAVGLKKQELTIDEVNMRWKLTQ